ncbi:MAG TPA: PIG-L family deacetylase [Luteimonas sp.]|nr:PIG-L family deacetylase [Luteimonas sp.]
MEIHCDRGDRLLVFAPHPDDESLACGALIHRALAAGAFVQVVIATNGDANPWPQRLVERRWHLDRESVARWGAMRKGEARAALHALGVPDDHVQFLQWPDQGLTARLVHDGQSSVAELAALIRLHRPTLVAMPSMRDSHPDHSALAILLKAALRAESSPARLLSYWLHGRGNAAIDSPMDVTLTPGELAAKRAAALSHVSQTHFGKARLLQFVGAGEHFLHPATGMPEASAQWRWTFKARGPLGLAGVRRVRVVAISTTGVLHASSFELRGKHGDGELRVLRRSPRTLTVEVDPLWPEPAWVVAKLDTDHSVNVYDPFRWIERLQPARAPSRIAPQPARIAQLLPDVAVAPTNTLAPTVADDHVASR